MKLIRHFFILSGLATLFFIIGGCSLFNSELVIGTSPNYFPYEYLTKDGKLAGFDVDLAKAIGRKLNQPIKFKKMEFVDLIPALEEGKIDLIMSGLSITSQREEHFDMIPYQEVSTKHLAIVFWENAPANLTNLEQFKDNNTEIAVQVGSFQDNYIESLEGINIVPLESNLELIKAIQEKKAAAALFEPHIADLMKELYPQLVIVETPLPPRLHSDAFGIGIAAKNHRLAKRLQKAVNELKADGTFAKLENEWFNPEPKPN